MRTVTRCIVACVVAGVASSAAAQSFEDRYFSSNGVRIRYIDQGQGATSVLGHDRSGGLQPFVDVGLMTNLAKDHRVLALDVRGHVKSDKPAA
jgi:pimeloyl-ACP methyl ester carboxylesterase